MLQIGFALDMIGRITQVPCEEYLPLFLQAYLEPVRGIEACFVLAPMLACSRQAENLIRGEQDRSHPEGEKLEAACRTLTYERVHS